MRKTHFAQIGLLALAACAPAFILTSHAEIGTQGLERDLPVTIDIDNGVAFGSIGDALDEDNYNAYIGCEVSSSDDGHSTPNVVGMCQAQDSKGVDILCTSWSPTLITAMRSLHEHSNLTFYFVPDVGHANKTMLPSFTCTSITVGTHSHFVNQD